MKISRNIDSLVKKRLKAYPAALLLGPRQVGKTTYAKTIATHYFDLEKEADRQKLDIQWPKLTKGKGLIVLDEAQAMPEIFPMLRSAIDEDRDRNGRFLLLGSIAPHLMKEVVQSLAGRIANISLSPFTLNEVSAKKVNELWFYGGYPAGGFLKKSQYPSWGRDYLFQLTHRDLVHWGLEASPQQTNRLLQMIAARQGQVWNASQLGKSLGVSNHTVNRYTDFLEGAFLVRKLQPFLPNLQKRLQKSPKVYLRDSGFLHALLNTNDYDHLLIQPWAGFSWEGFVIEQIIAFLDQTETMATPYYFKTSDDYEIDLVLDFGNNEHWAIEIKLSSQPRREDLKRLQKTAKLAKAKRYFLITQAEENIIEKDGGFCSLDGFLKELV